MSLLMGFIFYLSISLYIYRVFYRLYAKELVCMVFIFSLVVKINEIACYCLCFCYENEWVLFL